MKLQIIKQIQKTKRTVFLPLILCIIFSQSGVAGAREVVPVGKTVGITVDLRGVFVVSTAEFENKDGKMKSPASDAGIVAGDIILSINGNDINSAKSLGSILKNIGGDKMSVIVQRGDKEKEFNLRAEQNRDDNEYKLGIWIKDSSSGIGTLTYYDPQSMEFGALGHGICDYEDELTPIRSGRVLQASVASVKRGEKGSPGELIGVFGEESHLLGSVSLNTRCGIKGSLNKGIELHSELGSIPVAERSEVAEGAVTVLSNVEGNSVQEYSAEILKINKDEDSEKGMIIKITDERLIEKTGGIVRGMSGSPILQNGRIVGAVTHVFVNDPTRGYGIFIENMLAEAEKIK